jgi:peptidoglycan/xylan/chitin deacetylase (PgdA/CDA1 family)
MFHSVGNVNSSWSRRYLSINWRHFEHFCIYLKKQHYETLSLEEWYQYQDNKNSKSRTKTLVLTFDDGYLDNWVFAYPILKKYGLKGTIFINPEFVEPSGEPRANLEDCWTGRKGIHELESSGFLNWAEILLMDKNGVLDVQSHTMSHNFYFKSTKIIDFYIGQKEYDWMAWFYRPDRKPFYITKDQRNMVPYGTPVFEYGRSLGIRRFFPADNLNRFAIEFYDRSVKTDKLQKENLKQDFIKICNHFLDENASAGRWETEQETEKRYRYELFESKKIIEEKLNKKVEFLCWPGGGYNELSVKLSKEARYKASTLASKESINDIDNSGSYKRIPRFGLSSNIHTPKNIYALPYNAALVHWYKSLEVSIIYKIPIKFFSIIYKVWDKLIN